VYSIEGSTIQSKMVASSLFSSLTYQECRNEQEANIRLYNNDGGAERDKLLILKNPDMPPMFSGGASGKTPITSAYNSYAAKSDIVTQWSYIREAPAARGGFNVDTEAPTKAYLYENDCIATFRFATNHQTIGAIVEGLAQAGIVK
jgi:hypothetical protein